jgi:NAD(P)-dependent dehydrogenase (short-subunit alcohol dehydrogenase family)
MTPGRSAVESRVVPENRLLVEGIRRSDAGIEGKVAPTQEYDEIVFDAVIAINLKGVFLGLPHVLPVMLKQGHGAVVNTASVAGLFGSRGMAPYVASKHRVLGLTKVASADVARLGVRVNAICPGPVETRMMRSLESQRNPANPRVVHDSNRRCAARHKLAK